MSEELRRIARAEREAKHLSVLRQISQYVATNEADTAIIREEMLAGQNRKYRETEAGVEACERLLLFTEASDTDAARKVAQCLREFRTYRALGIPSEAMLHGLEISTVDDLLHVFEALSWQPIGRLAVDADRRLTGILGKFQLIPAEEIQ